MEGTRGTQFRPGAVAVVAQDRIDRAAPAEDKPPKLTSRATLVLAEYLRLLTAGASQLSRAE